MQFRVSRTTLLMTSLLLSARTALGDPVTITSGFAMLPFAGVGSALFSMAGDNFSVTGRWDDPVTVPAAVCAHGCAPGQMLTLSTSLQNLFPQTAPVELVASGSAMVNGVTLPFVEFVGSIGFFTPAVTLPPITGDGVTLTAPFSFGGVIQGWDPLARDAVLLFSQEVTGIGTATARLPASPNSYTFGLLRYDFAQTPEPATVSLIVIGAGSGWLFRHRRR